jgi:DUF1680 family protein
MNKLSRRELITIAASMATSATFLPSGLLANQVESNLTAEEAKRFPYFKSTPVPFFDVKLQDAFWAPRQKVLHDVTVPWATRHYDGGGGLEAFKAHPEIYKPDMRMDRAVDNMAVNYIEAMAAVIGVSPDKAIEGLCRKWGQQIIDGQDPDGYSTFTYPLGADRSQRWKPIWWSHEDYTVGEYLEAAIGYKESTGDTALYDSAKRAVDNMAGTFLGSNRAYVSGHEEIEQALMRLYGITGDARYLKLAGWFIAQRGHHEGRPSFSKYSQDHLPVEQQRTIEGHAVRAAYLFNGVTEYVGATGNTAYREAVLAVWDDFANHKMYLHGGGGLKSKNNEGYSSTPDFLPLDDCYGESCSVFANFKWAHNLFRLTGDASYIDVAERMLYNAFYASLSLDGDRFFYENPLQTANSAPPITRLAWHSCPCCPPNITKLFAKIGGFFYSINQDSIYIKHYAASEAHIALSKGVKLLQRTDFPWNGKVTIEVEPKIPTRFALRLRKPEWAKSHAVSLNGQMITAETDKGWLVIHRLWKAGDRVELDLAMTIDRITMPARFKEYAGLVAVQRGPIVYCLEEQDAALPMEDLFVPSDVVFTAEYRPDLLGGVTVLRASIRRITDIAVANDVGKDVALPAMFVPYGVWGNRNIGAMKVWFPTKSITLEDGIKTMPITPFGEQT